jgi:hypothetical protein
MASPAELPSLREFPPAMAEDGMPPESLGEELVVAQLLRRANGGHIRSSRLLYISLSIVPPGDFQQPTCGSRGRDRRWWRRAGRITLPWRYHATA